MGETDLTGFDECNYVLKSAAGVNSLPSQLALVARSLRLCLPQLSAHRQGLQTRTHTVSSPQTSHRYRPTALQQQPPIPSHQGSGTLHATPKILNEYVERKDERLHTRIPYTHLMKHTRNVALGCNLYVFLEVLCENTGITMTPISSHTH